MRENSGSLEAALQNGARLLERDPVAAIEQATAVLEVNPGQPGALRLLGCALRKVGQPERAAKAEAAAIASTARSPEIRAAREAMAQNDLAAAEHIIRPIVSHSPDDVVATMLLADIASALGIHTEAERLLRHAVEIAPDYPDSRISLAQTRFLQGHLGGAIQMLDDVLATNPGHIGAAGSKADILIQTGSYDLALEIYRGLLDADDTRADVWLWYGHLLKTLGRQAEALSAYRSATAIDPTHAEAWWSLSELKANKVEPADIARMQQALEADPTAAEQVYLHFALGKALEDRKDWLASFRHYAAANEYRLILEPHDSAAVSTEVDQSINLFTRDFFLGHEGSGFPSHNPIFIIGMPRAGSTLIEQILASHSQIEGTSELPDIPLIVQSLIANRWRDKAAAYPGIVDDLSAHEFYDLGERYIKSAASKRKTPRPLFIDKLPNNWRYLGLIHLILPNAKIIDARRDAMACCFSNFRQHFSRGQTFAYSMQGLGSYYRDYMRAMAHYDRVLPSAVHRVQHEELVENPEREIRRMLDYLGLPFEETCLRPHENTRPVRTASSEQVRQPISRKAFDLWSNYEPWLDDLKAALGDAWSAAQR